MSDEKSLGQVAYETLGMHDSSWVALGDATKERYEAAAEAVKQAVLAEVKEPHSYYDRCPSCGEGLARSQVQPETALERKRHTIALMAATVFPWAIEQVRRNLIPEEKTFTADGAREIACYEAEKLYNEVVAEAEKREGQ